MTMKQLTLHAATWDAESLTLFQLVVLIDILGQQQALKLKMDASCQCRSLLPWEETCA